MKKSLLFLALAVPALAFAKDPEPVNPPAPLPSFATKVYPSQGFIDLSGDVNPLGVGEITLDFSGELTVNNDVHSQLYKEGVFFKESVRAAVDAMGVNKVSINFGTVTSAGWYEVRVPEGQFNVNGELSTAFNLFYEIDVPYQIGPAPGCVIDLQNVVFLFEGANEITLNSNTITSDSPLEFTYVCSSDRGSYDISVQPEGEAVFFNFSSGGIAVYSIETPGTYTLTVPAGYLEAHYYGPNHSTDSTDEIVRKNPRFVLKYIVPAFPQPAIEPDTEETVEGFLTFVLTMPEGAQLGFPNNRSLNGIYPVNTDGTIDKENLIYEARYKSNDDGSLSPGPSCDPEKGTVTLYLYNPNAKYEVVDANGNTIEMTGDFYTEMQKPLPGDYALVLSDGSFTLSTWTSLLGTTQWFVQCAPFQYIYHVENDTTSNVDEVVVADPETFTVYSVSGVLVARNAKADVLKNLPNGLYIVNGKKVLKH